MPTALRCGLIGLALLPGCVAPGAFAADAPMGIVMAVTGPTDPPPQFVVVSVAVIETPGPPTFGAVNAVTARSGPIEIERDSVLFVSFDSTTTLSSSALAMM